jgi:phosphate transport system substrate-binding protein
MLRYFLLGFQITLLCACIPTADQPEQKLTLTGSSTVAPLAMEMAQRYEKEHPDIRIEVQTGGSSRGIADARKQAVDIGMVSRALHNDENDLNAYLLAMDGIGIIIHKSIPVTKLSRKQVIAIFTGKVTNWQKLGGPDQKISIVHKAEGRSTSELFLNHFELQQPDIKADVIVGDNEQGIKNVATIPGAIGYVSIGAAETAIAENSAIRLTKLDGIAASSANVANGSFPLIRQLNFVVKGEPSPLAQEFIAYARSQKVFDLVKNLDFVPRSL